MNFQIAPDSCGLINRYTSGTIEVGLFPTIFGVRARAGRINELSYNVDWCCGADPKVINFTFNLLIGILSAQTEELPFLNIPTCSNIKPINNDLLFLDYLCKLPQVKLPNLPTPEMSEVRHRFKQANQDSTPIFL